MVKVKEVNKYRLALATIIAPTITLLIVFHILPNPFEIQNIDEVDFITFGPIFGTVLFFVVGFTIGYGFPVSLWMRKIGRDNYFYYGLAGLAPSLIIVLMFFPFRNITDQTDLYYLWLFSGPLTALIYRLIIGGVEYEEECDG